MTNKTQNSKLKTQNYILYLDTSEPEAVLAIYSWKGETLPGGLSIVREERWLAHRELSATLADKYRGLLTSVAKKVLPLEQLEHLEQFQHVQRSLSGIVVFVGPGSFTGLRIGISFANGLAYALGITVYETKKKEDFILANPKKIATPYYGREPHITKSRK